MIDIARPKIEGSIAVADGDRRIGFAEYGSATGRAIIWLHGTPGARRQIPVEARGYAAERGVRLIGLDRPGVGSSTPHRYENIAAFAPDLEDVLEALGIDEFVLSGYPHLEELYWFGEGVLPILRERALFTGGVETTASGNVPFLAAGSR